MHFNRAIKFFVLVVFTILLNLHATIPLDWNPNINFHIPTADAYAVQQPKFVNSYLDDSEFVRWLESIRRDLHQYPELKFEEVRTSSQIQSILTSLNISFTTGWGAQPNSSIAGTGIVAEIGTGKSPCVLLRADMDALPIQEKASVSFKSKHDGIMHACGHDAHVTMLLGAAKMLKEHESELKGTVRLMFQPAEEGGAGAHHMINEGVLTKYPPVQRAFALHVNSEFPVGTLLSNEGAILAAADSFELEVVGKGGHAAIPHESRDPIATASLLIQSLYTFANREFPSADPTKRSLLSITSIHAGDAMNVIPVTAKIGGTIRSLSNSFLKEIRLRIVQIAETISSSFFCTCNVKFSDIPYLVTQNDKGLYDLVKKVFTNNKIIQFQESTAIMGGEDFGFISNSGIPAIMCWIGNGNNSYFDDSISTTHSIHSPHFAINEAVLPKGAYAHTLFAWHSLNELSAQQVEEEL